MKTIEFDCASGALGVFHTSCQPLLVNVKVLQRVFAWPLFHELMSFLKRFTRQEGQLLCHERPYYKIVNDEMYVPKLFSEDEG